MILKLLRTEKSVGRRWLVISLVCCLIVSCNYWVIIDVEVGWKNRGKKRDCFALCGQRTLIFNTDFIMSLLLIDIFTSWVELYYTLSAMLVETIRRAMLVETISRAILVEYWLTWRIKPTLFFELATLFSRSHSGVFFAGTTHCLTLLCSKKENDKLNEWTKRPIVTFVHRLLGIIRWCDLSTIRTTVG